MNAKITKKMQIVSAVVLVSARLAYHMANLPYRPYVAVVMGLLYTLFVFNGSIKSKLIWTILTVVVDGIINACVISIFLLFPGSSIQSIDTPGTNLLMLITLSKVVLFAAYYLMTLNVDRDEGIEWKDFGLLLLVPTGCWVLLEIVFQYVGSTLDRISYPILAAGSVLILFMNMGVVLLYNRITSNTKELARSKMQLRMAEMTKDHIGEIHDIYSQLSTVRHDLNNHFAAISGYLHAKDYNSLEKYIAQLTDVDMGMPEYVTHPVLNALISVKSTIAKNANIDFTSQIILPEKLPLSDVDICILISNILDNAFEANRDAIEPKYIYLSAKRIDAYWVIACRNATRLKGKLKSSGVLKSTKSTEGIHGIGTRQINMIAQKAGGFVSYRHVNYEFFTLVTLLLSEEADSQTCKAI